MYGYAQILYRQLYIIDISLMKLEIKQVKGLTKILMF